MDTPLETKYHFEWGTQAEYEEGEYGHLVPAPDEVIGSASEVQVRQTLSDLVPHTTYHFRTVAENAEGTSYGEDVAFTTPEWALGSVGEPEGGHASNLLGSSCTSPTECMTVGYYTDPEGVKATLAERRVGGQWSVLATPDPEGATQSRLTSVSCADPEQCIAVGYYTAAGHNLPFAERWDGSSWTLESVANPEGATQAYLESVSCPGQGFCLAAGRYIASGAEHPLAARWDGSAFSLDPSVKSGKFGAGTLHGVSCSSAGDCWAVGRTRPTKAEEEEAWAPVWEAIEAGEEEVAEELYEQAEEELVPQALLERFDGEAWAPADPPAAAPASFVSVSCPGQGFCAAVADQGLWVARYGGSEWIAEEAATPSPGHEAVLKAISCTSATACTAVGHYKPEEEGEGEFAFYNSAPLAEHWGGSSWVTEQTTDPAGIFEPDLVHEGYLRAVSCATASACTATGYYTGLDEESEIEALVVEAHPTGTAPSVSTEAATDTEAPEVTLNATVDPDGEDTAYRFEYVDDAAYLEGGFQAASLAPEEPEAIGSASEDIEVHQRLGGLEPGTTYHFRVVAENNQGASVGTAKTFTTPG